MSWTTSSPYSSHRSFSRQQTQSTAATTPPAVESPKPVPRSLTLLSGDSLRTRTPISPHKLAKLANALGVATPAPVSVPYPLYSPTTTHTGSSFGNSSSTPSRYLVHVIPPLHLLLAEQEDFNDPHDQAQFRRGTLVPLHPTLNSQLGAIAREYSLPSIGGMILYLITDSEAGPRITDDAWRMLWYRALQMDKDGSSNGKAIARMHSRTKTSSANNSPYPSPSTTSESPYRSTSPSNDNASFSSFDLPLNINPASALPILAKVEFDIDRRKAPWYERWKHRRRTTSHSVVTSPQLLGGFNGSGSRRELQLPLRARSTSPSLADFKAKYATSASASSAQITLNSPEESERGDYIQLEDDTEPRKMIHNGEFTDDPLDDVFPSDKTTWAQIHNEQGNEEPGSPTSPHTPDVMIGGRIGSTILSMEAGESGGESGDDADEEDVLTMWKDRNKPTLDGLSAPGSPSSRPTSTRARSASKHVPPPLDLSSSSKGQIPHVEVAPPTATDGHMSVNSDLPYLDSDAASKAGANSSGIQIVVDSTSDSGSGKLNAGDGSPRRGSASSEEARSRRLDELERRIENFSPKSQWDEENELESQQSIIVESPEASPQLTPTIAFENDSEQDHTARLDSPSNASASALPVPSTKASRRQVSIGSFNSIPGASNLAQALAGAPLESPPLPPLPAEAALSETDEDDEPAQVVSLLPPIDLASAAPSPNTPGFPMSPDPFHRDGFFGKAMKVEIPPSALAKGAKDETGSPVSPPMRVSSRFSADSATSDEGGGKSGLRAERSGSMISVKGIRSLWRKSGNNKVTMQPLMSPGINGQHMIPPTPPPYSGAPPLPFSAAGGFLSISSAPRTPTTPTTPSSNASTVEASTLTTTPGSSNAPTTHGRSDSGLDPFHFDQESRYPVHKMPSPSQAFADSVPPPALEAQSPSPPPPSSAGGLKKGILKGWGSKGSLKRSSVEAQSQNPPPSSFGSGKKHRQPSITGVSNGHSKSNSKASISSVGTNSKHSGSGTSHASSHSHQGTATPTPTPNLPFQFEPPPSLSPSPLPGSSGRSSPASVNIGHKTTGSNGSALTVGSEGRRSSDRKSTPPPPGAVAIAAAVAASRERRGTSYIGPADNRI